MLLVDRPSEGVVLLTLDLPDRRNAMTDELTAAWVAAMGALRGDRTVRCVVVTGAGRAFCAGGDLGWLAAGGASVDELRDKMLPFYRAWLSLRDLDVPSVAAVNGPAVGAGAALALSCDIRYAGPAASLSVPFAQLGMHAGMATTYTLTEVAGVAAARELLLTGRSVGADEMLRLGLCSAVFEDLLPAALERAAQVAAGAPVASRLHKEALRDGGPASLERALAWEAVAQPVTMTTADLQEGLQAKAEKRPARFTGH
ncbi:MAG TPA: enoyl-CoA hydratase/isomerase family protein [Mycobacteriales bacterium]|nr:enoyl-CoA hydratase/isomerase family protein [Mycobacteriales bacterium]